MGHISLNLDSAFWQFHYGNPHVYELLVRFAREAQRQGRGRFGIGAIWERMRWYLAFETTESLAGGLKINNNYRSRYARLLQRQEPALGGLFQTRRLRTASTFEDVV